jgi:tyrosine-protein kinase Etk/Wzc
MENNTHIASTENEIDLKTVFNILQAHKWILLAALFVGFFIGYLLTLRITPQYQASALLHIDDQVSSSSVLSGLSGFTGAVSKASPAQVQTALIKSRFVLQPLIQKLGLNISAKPNYYPFFGKMLANRYQGKTVATAPLGLNKYAWGGESIKVAELNVDPSISNNKPLTLTANKNHQFTLSTQNGEVILKGNVGTLAISKKYPNTSILVSQLNARPQENFSVKLIPMKDIINKLKNNISVTDAGQTTLNKNLDTGVLNINLKWPDPHQLPLIVDDLIKIAKQKNVQQKSQEAGQQLQFVEQQTPILQQALNQSEQKLNDYKSKKGILDISAEAQEMIQEASQLTNQKMMLTLRRKSLLQRFMPSHPAILDMNDQIKEIQGKITQLDHKIKTLPHMDQQAITLTRNVTIKEKLYTQLQARIQQLKIIQAGTVGDVQILNKSTVPLKPLPMRKGLIIVATGIGLLMLTAMAYLIKQLLFSGISDPDELEERIGLRVHAVIPHSKIQEEYDHKKNTDRIKILALKSPKDTAIEGLRGLRTTLNLSTSEETNNIINIMGASPGIGKSFISLNLGCVFAESNKKVILLSADMRKGKLYQKLSLKKAPGLSEYLKENNTLEDIIQSTAQPGLDFISAGKYPQNPAELLSQPQLKDLLDKLSTIYDKIIIDTPPIMAVTDACLIGQFADTNLLAVGLGKNQLREVKATIKRLQVNKINCDGMICNYYSKKVMYYANNKYGYYYYSYK